MRSLQEALITSGYLEELFFHKKERELIEKMKKNPNPSAHDHKKKERHLKLVVSNPDHEVLSAHPGEKKAA